MVDTLVLQLFAVPLGYLVVWVVLRGVQMWWWRRSLTAWEIRLPQAVTVEQVSRWVGLVRAVVRARRWWSLIPRWPIGVEITATREGVSRMLLVLRRLRGDVLATLSAVVPGARLIESPTYLAQSRRVGFRVAAEARLTGADELLAIERGEDVNRHLLAALQPLEAGELVRVQWLLAGARNVRAYLPEGVSKQEAGRLGDRWKQCDPMLLAACRVGVASRFGSRRARSVFGRVWAALRGMNTPWAQIVRRRGWPCAVVAWRVRIRAVPLRCWPLLLTAPEVGGLLGLAGGVEALPGLPVGVSRTLPPPPPMPSAGLVIAHSNYPGVSRNLCLAREDRLRHLWMIGPTGVGKSTVLANMITYDMHRGDGLVVIDARGDLVADVLDRVPKHRHDDVIVMDATTTDQVIGFNPLQGGPPEQAAGFIYHVLHSVYASAWGPRTADIVRAALLTLTATKASNGQGFTFIDMPELLTNTGFRRLVTAQPLSPQLGAFWRWYEGLSEPARVNAISPVLNKLRTFTLSTPLRLMLGQSEGINMTTVLADKKIVLVALKKGLLGAETSGLIGSLIIAAVWQAALGRATMPPDRRRPFWLVVDEFQDVVKLPLDLTDMLAQARGLGLGLILAHQYLAQLTPELKAAVVGTARSHLVFQLGHSDAKELAPSFTPLNAEDLQYLGAYEIALRPCVGGATLGPVTGTTFPMPQPCTDGTALAQASRRCYGVPRTQIDTECSARVTVVPAGTRANRIIAGGQP